MERPTYPYDLRAKWGGLGVSHAPIWPNSKSAKTEQWPVPLWHVCKGGQSEGEHRMQGKLSRIIINYVGKNRSQYLW